MKVVAAMSGGVDSSVAAVLLQRAGHDVLGVHLRMRDDAISGSSNCINPQHEADARAVAESHGIPFQTLDMRAAFEIEVARPFMEAYRLGETPNPCVLCNVKVKLGPLVVWARERGFEAIATGHYARVQFDDATGRWQLRRGVTPSKDQSYYLCALGQDVLAHFILPLGEIEKSETRKLAREFNLSVAEKHDSQDICLTASDGGDYRLYLSRRLGEESLGGEGPIVNTRGERLGQHTGLANYTIGQRKGLRISHPRPLYVVALEPESNTLVVGEEEELYATSLRAGPFNWSSIAAPQENESFRAQAQIRYQHKAAPATITVLPGDQVEMTFDQPQRAICPGQIAVVYNGDLVLGGGKIQKR